MIKIPRDRKFEKGRKDSRMPVRDVHGDERMDAGKREQDFELRRPRDAPVHGREKRYRQNGTIDRQQRAEPRPGDGSGSGGERAEYERFGRDERSASFSDTERLHPEPDKTVQSGENGKRRRRVFRRRENSGWRQRRIRRPGKGKSG